MIRAQQALDDLYEDAGQRKADALAALAEAENAYKEAIMKRINRLRKDKEKGQEV